MGGGMEEEAPAERSAAEGEVGCVAAGLKVERCRRELVRDEYWDF